jgi:hypothetical protein
MTRADVGYAEGCTAECVEIWVDSVAFSSWQRRWLLAARPRYGFLFNVYRMRFKFYGYGAHPKYVFAL